MCIFFRFQSSVRNTSYNVQRLVMLLLIMSRDVTFHENPILCKVLDSKLPTNDVFGVGQQHKS